MKIFKAIPFLLPMFSTTAVFAQEDGPKKIDELFGVLDNVLKYVFPLAGLICVIFIIVGGYMWISAAGDPSRVKAAQSTLSWAIICFVVVLLAVAVIEVITKFVS